MRRIAYKKFGGLISSVRAQSQAGSQLEERVPSLAAAQSVHAAAGEACWGASIHSTSSHRSSPCSQVSLSHSVPVRTCSLPSAHGSSLAQQRSFAASGGNNSGVEDDTEALKPSRAESSPVSEPEGSSVGQTPRHTGAAERDGQQSSDSAVSASSRKAAESQGPIDVVDAESKDLWELTDEQRQAERVLLAPPSGEPLYPDKRGSFAWEPFADDDMEEGLTVRIEDIPVPFRK